MQELPAHIVQNQIFSAVCFGTLAFFVSFFAKKKDFFRFLYPSSLPPLTAAHFFLFFGFYLSIHFFVTPVLAFFLKFFLSKDLPLFSCLELLIAFFVFSFFFYFFAKKDKKLFFSIWKNGSNKNLAFSDISFGFFSWFLAFPIVSFANQLLDLFNFFVFHILQTPDQVAVKYLKMTWGHPFHFTVALSMILLYAPIVEEFLFRGILQNFLKAFMGRMSAIVFSSFFFALFHFSFSQGYGNISLIGSLFVLALFLGFVYERKNSLFSSITLHATFNAVSIIQLFLLKEGVFSCVIIS